MKIDTLSPAYENLRARMHLSAVFATMADLVEQSDEAQKLIAKKDFTLSLNVRGGLRGALTFEEGRARSLGELPERSDIALYFLSARKLNALFTGEAASFPILLKGWLRPRQLLAFKKMSKLLESYLKPNDESMKDEAFAKAHVRLSLAVSVRALAELINNHDAARDFIRSGPSGLAAFGLLGESQAAWIRVDDDEATSGWGEPPVRPDVEVRFANTQVGCAVLEDRADVMAEVGRGNIRVHGLLPLADNLGVLMQALPHYLDVS